MLKVFNKIYIVPWCRSRKHILSCFFVSGRILNRFSKDIGNMDDYLPITFFDFTQVRYLSWFPVDTLVMPISLVPVEIWSIKQICNIIMRTLNCLKMKMFDLYSTSALILNSVLPVSMWVF